MPEGNLTYYLFFGLLLAGLIGIYFVVRNRQNKE
jgi:LPXTG-motif cell wall-anchored protein